MNKLPINAHIYSFLKNCFSFQIKLDYVEQANSKQSFLLLLKFHLKNMSSKTSVSIIAIRFYASKTSQTIKNENLMTKILQK